MAQPSPPARDRPHRFVTRQFVRDRYHQAQIYVGNTLEPASDLAAYFALVLLSTAFGESMSSRLFQRIREDRGLCYSVGSFRTYYSDTWSWAIYANAMPDLVPQLLGALNHELHDLVDRPLSEQEVGDAVSHITGSMVFAKEDMESRMKRLASQYQMFGRTFEMAESARLLRQVAAADVAALSARLMQPGHFNLLSYGTRNMNGMRDVPFELVGRYAPPNQTGGCLGRGLGRNRFPVLYPRDGADRGRRSCQPRGAGRSRRVDRTGAPRAGRRRLRRGADDLAPRA